MADVESRVSICIDIGKVLATAYVKQAGAIIGIQGDGGGGGGGGGGLTIPTADTLYVNISGDTMMGPLRLYGWPSSPQDAVSKAYVDSLQGSGGTGGMDEVYIGNQIPTGGQELFLDLDAPDPEGGGSGGGADEVYIGNLPPTGGQELFLDLDAPDPSASMGGAVRTASFTTPSIASGARTTGAVQLGSGYRLFRIRTDEPARVRLYTTADKRDADLEREIGTDPSGDHGLILEFISSADQALLAADLSPMVDGFDGKAIPDGLIPYSVTNRRTDAGTITVTFVYREEEPGPPAVGQVWPRSNFPAPV